MSNKEPFTMDETSKWVRQSDELYGLQQAKRHSRLFDEMNDCAVISVAMVCDVSYEEAWKKLHELGRKHQCGVQNSLILNAVESFGFNLVPFDADSKTVRTLEREMSVGTQLVFVHRHVLAMRNGQILDWTRGRLHKVKQVYCVFKSVT